MDDEFGRASSIFRKHGEIQNAFIISDRESGKSRGFGFVKFGTSEAGHSALGELNPTIEGRRVFCDLARSIRVESSHQSSAPQLWRRGTSQGSSPASPPQATRAELPPPPPACAATAACLWPPFFLVSGLLAGGKGSGGPSFSRSSPSRFRV
jgi:RNA recognition motif-containing protein